MTKLDDVRKTIEAALGALTPAKAQQLARGILEPNAAKEQVAKLAADLLEWSQRSRDRIVDVVRHEIGEQLHQMGGATQDELDALKKRVRELERRAGMTASGRAKTGSAAAKTPATKKASTRKPAAKKAPSRPKAT